MEYDILTPNLEIQYITKTKLTPIYQDGALVKYYEEKREIRFRGIPFLYKLAWRFNWEIIQPEGLYARGKMYVMNNTSHILIDKIAYYRPSVKVTVKHRNTGKVGTFNSYFNTDKEMEDYVNKMYKTIKLKNND